MYIKNQPEFTKYLISDFVEIQRKSFFTLLEKGIIEEFSKRNPITNTKKTMELFFYPEYYQLTPPEYTPKRAILKSKSYTSRLYMPVQLTDKTSNLIKLKWVYIGDIPLMTKRGHFILNGCARVIVNQMIRSPGIYYQKKIYENFVDKWSEKPETMFVRYYADLICNRGTWLRIEMDKYNKIWAQMKRVPKIPIMLFLIAVGLPEKIILKYVTDSHLLLDNFDQPASLVAPKGQEQSGTQYMEPFEAFSEKSQRAERHKKTLPYVKTPPAAWASIYNIVFAKKTKKPKVKEIPLSGSFQTKKTRDSIGGSFQPSGLILSESPQRAESFGAKEAPLGSLGLQGNGTSESGTDSQTKTLTPTLWDAKARRLLPQRGDKKANPGSQKQNKKKAKKDFKDLTFYELISLKNTVELKAEQGRKWIFNRFMNPRTYDLGKVGRLNINRKLKTTINTNICTLTPQDFLAATNHLILVSKGLRELDDIDHLKNRRIRTSGELIQMQIGVGLVRLEKTIREKMNKIHTINTSVNISFQKSLTPSIPSGPPLERLKRASGLEQRRIKNNQKTPSGPKTLQKPEKLTIHNIMNTKPFNGALREFFGTSPLSQFMDQINPLAELTHKRRLSSMGPGGVTRDSATLAIRGIHPSHYGRICPVETPEGKNTGLVNSLTAYARVNSEGYIETPFYRVYKGQVQKKTGLYFFSAKQEEKIKLGAPDLYTSNISFLPKASIPVRIIEDFKKISRDEMQYVGVAPIQMISIATSLIPFFEHDDANRALMGSNMQRQAVPILKPQRPIVGTGLEMRAVSDSGHVVTAKYSGVLTYATSTKMIIYSLT